MVAGRSLTFFDFVFFDFASLFLQADRSFATSVDKLRLSIKTPVEKLLDKRSLSTDVAKLRSGLSIGSTRKIDGKGFKG
jgi:hypothetical protein